MNKAKYGKTWFSRLQAHLTSVERPEKSFLFKSMQLEKLFHKELDKLYSSLYGKLTDTYPTLKPKTSVRGTLTKD